jgi:hypothetical protein
MNHFYQSIGEDWFTYPELYSNMVREASDGAKFVEVGSWRGRSASFMGVEIHNSNKKIYFDCVDTWKGSVEHQSDPSIINDTLYSEFLSNTKSLSHIIRPIRLSSLEAAKLYDDNSLDFVFIDASHEYNDVVDDINAWLPKVKEGGTLAGHDIGNHDVKKAVDSTLKSYQTIDGCWVVKKNNLASITFVTGLWDIGRDDLNEGWGRSFKHYLEKFEELLKIPYNLIIFGDEKLEEFVYQRRSKLNTQFIVRSKDKFKQSEYYPLIQGIRNKEEWYNQAGWLKDSTQARLELYNPLVMTKMFFLNDARILSKFNDSHIFWIDAGLTNTVHVGYLTDKRVMNNLIDAVTDFSFVCFPYEAINEIHGFDYKAICNYTKAKVNKVARGGFFGGPSSSVQDVNGIYYNTLITTLNEGYMGTEESIFSIMVYNNADKISYFNINSDGLLYTFFDNLGTGKLVASKEKPQAYATHVTYNKTAMYIITFNSPDQFEAIVESWKKQPRFITETDNYLLDNSSDLSTTPYYQELCKKYNFTHIKKDNLGICGGRQFVAEHFSESKNEYYIFLEDDMLLEHNEGKCANGFTTNVENLFDKTHKIIAKHDFDFLKFSFTEVYGDNRTQWAWYNVPQSVRSQIWPDYDKLPSHGLDPNAPLTRFNHIYNLDGLCYADGDIYYCNWPQLVSKKGNKKMFLDDKWAYPYEQTWMSHMFQMVLRGELQPAVLLASPINHCRFKFYDGKLRKES